MTKRLLFLFSLTSTVVFGQSFEIRGRIIERDTPLSFVTVLAWAALPYGFDDNPKQHKKSLNTHQEHNRLN